MDLEFGKTDVGPAFFSETAKAERSIRFPISFFPK
jgi:hypothetical protein